MQRPLILLAYAAAVALGMLLQAPSVPAADWIYPIDVAVGTDDTIYIADRNLPGIWTLKDGKTEVFIQASKRFKTPLNAIRCLYVSPDSTLYAGDSATREVFQVAADGALTQLTSPNPALKGTKLSPDLAFTPDNFGDVQIPMKMVADSKGNLYVSDTDLQRVWKVPAGGGKPQEFFVVAGPRGLAIDSDDNVYVLAANAPQLRRVAPDGTATVLVKDAPIDYPHQVALRDGTLYVSSGYDTRGIWKVTPDGAVEKWIGGDPLVNPVGIAWQGENLLIIDPRANALFSAAPDGTLTKVFPAVP